MTKQEILEEVKRIITKVSRATIEEIKETHKIKSYIPVIDAPNLALKVWESYKIINTTNLLNSLFDPISTISDLVNYIYETYENE